MTVYDTPEAAKAAQSRLASPDFETLTEDGELVAAFGSVTVHLFLAPLDSEPFGFLLEPAESTDASSELEALLQPEALADPAAAFYALADATDAAHAWAYRHGFVSCGDEPLPTDGQAHGGRVLTWALRVQ